MIKQQHHWIARSLRIAVGLLLLALTAQMDFSEPFGLPTVAATNGPLIAIWRSLQSEIESEQPIIARCRAEPHTCTSAAALQFIAIVKEGEQYDGLARIGRINRAVNRSIRSINTTTPGGLRTIWTSPLDTLAGGLGDCKQFAMVKYLALSEAGFAPDDFRLIIVRVKSTRDFHAVVAVRYMDRWFILDNRTLAIVASSELPDFVPRFALDHRGVREFVLPSDQIVAGLPCDPTTG